MNIKSLGLKNKLVNDVTGEEYLDLSAPSFEYSPEFGIKAIHYVLPDQAGRIDLVSQQYFGSSQYIDLICMLNSISNPFSIAEGDILYIPNVLRHEEEIYFRPPVASRPNAVQAQYINTDRSTKKDQSRVERLAERGKGRRGAVANALPPNVLQPGQTGKEFEGGAVKLGTNLPTRKR